MLRLSWSILKYYVNASPLNFKHSVEVHSSVTRRALYCHFVSVGTVLSTDIT